jgi:hypothetical protein
MDWKQLLSDLNKHLEENARQSNNNVKVASNNMWDRIKMRDPEVQGPRLPETTPEEQAFAEENMSMAMGSLGNVGKAAKAVAPALEKAGVKAALESISNPMEKMVRGQQGMSRAADYADRLADQTKQVKLDRLKKYLGR